MEGLVPLNADSSSLDADPSGSLVLRPAGRTDLWKRTYYEPEIDKANAPALLRKIAWATCRCSVRARLTPVHQFDQGGILVFADEAHWLKAGLEFVDGACMLSVVVTNAGWSDWSTQPWPHGAAVRIRVHRVRGCSFVVEARPAEGGAEEAWTMIRVTHIDVPEGALSIGPYACVPGPAAELEARFDELEFAESEGYHHAA